MEEPSVAVLPTPSCWCHPKAQEGGKPREGSTKTRQKYGRRMAPKHIIQMANAASSSTPFCQGRAIACEALPPTSSAAAAIPALQARLATTGFPDPQPTSSLSSDIHGLLMRRTLRLTCAHSGEPLLQGRAASMAR